MQFRTTCLKESVEMQKEIISIEKKLFSLNPLSTALQLDYDLTIAASEVTGILVPIAAALRAKAALIKVEQVQLDLVQRGLIQTAEVMVALNTSKVEMKMLQDSSKLSRAWSLFLRSFYVIRPSHIAQVSVRASTSGVAPNYELTTNYKQDQKVAFKWQLKYSTRAESQTLLKSENSFELECQATPLEKGNSWSIEI